MNLEEVFNFYKGKKVLVTGHTGFKGTWLSRILVNAGAEVTGYSLNPPTDPALFNMAGLEGKMNSVIGDIRDLAHLKQVFEDTKPEIVLHLAAQPIVRDSYKDPVYTYETNVIGTVNILECVRLNPCVKSFLNVTTDKVYENREWEYGYREVDRLDGYDPYSNSKSCSELVTHSYRKSFFADGHCAISTCRAGNVIGGGDFANDRIVPDCVRAAMAKKPIVVLSLFEQLVGAGGVSAKEKSILDRCTYDVYREYMANNYEGAAPTLKDLYHSLLKQPEPEARGLALSSELFITGSLNTFAQHTNVDTKARIIAYDIRELGEQLMPIGMLVTLDAIFNRVIQNWKKGKTTWVFADEFYLLFRYQYSADFFYKLWKRIRKYNGLVTGLTQNVEELLRSDTARLMLANSEFLLLLNQSSTDRDELANLLHISDTQLGYITNVAAGCGLIRCAGNIVPFENSFPRNTRLYQLMTTKPDEALRGV